MKVSVITVSFQSVATIESCIQSVIGQNYPDIEYIIIDGASTDGTLDVIERYRDKIAKVVSEPDEGIYFAMNKGVELASGDLIGMLNSDDLYAGNQVISEVVKAILDSGADSCYGDLVYVDRQRTDKVLRTWKAGEYKKEAFLKGWMPPHPTFFLRRECYNTFGQFNTALRTSADYELMLRMLYKHGRGAVYLNKTLVLMRAGGQSNVSLKNRLKANREDRLAWQLNDLKPGLFTTLRKPLSKIGQFLKRS